MNLSRSNPFKVDTLPGFVPKALILRVLKIRTKQINLFCASGKRIQFVDDAKGVDEVELPACTVGSFIFFPVALMSATKILVTSLFLFGNLLIGEKVPAKNMTICQAPSIVRILFAGLY